MEYINNLKKINEYSIKNIYHPHLTIPNLQVYLPNLKKIIKIIYIIYYNYNNPFTHLEFISNNLLDNEDTDAFIITGSFIGLDKLIKSVNLLLNIYYTQDVLSKENIKPIIEENLLIINEECKIAIKLIGKYFNDNNFENDFNIY